MLLRCTNYFACDRYFLRGTVFAKDSNINHIFNRIYVIKNKKCFILVRPDLRTSFSSFSLKFTAAQLSHAFIFDCCMANSKISQHVELEDFFACTLIII